MDLQKSIIGIGLAGEERISFLTGDLIAQQAKGSFGFGDDRGISLGLTEFDQAGVVSERLLEAQNAPDATVELLAGPHEGLRFLRIAPNGRIFGLNIQIGEPLLG
jgi:hypothetical protein